MIPSLRSRARRWIAPCALALTLAVAAPAAAAPFGGEADVAFAERLWRATEGYEQWPWSSGVYPGTSPHGAYLRVYYNFVRVGDASYHVIVKDNFGGPDADEQKVAADQQAYLKAVTMMVQRREGYDPEHGDWFWVKYGPDGGVLTNPQDRPLAGRVAAGSDKGCIACHGRAGGGDYVFTNDGM